MKIEDTPFHFNGTSTTGPARHHALPFGPEDLDLSFLELLTSLPESAPSAAKKPETAEPDRLEKTTAEKTVEFPTGRPKLRLIKSESAPVRTEESTQDVQDALELLRADLTAEDVQYMKQVVIPALPIVMGTVPFQNIFTDKTGQISYRGFEVSPKLAELIEQGYKTGRPIRVELDRATAVVLKIRNGQVSAEFMSTDKNVALYMKQELDDLRHRMALRNLPVGTLEYRDPHQSRQQREQRDEDPER